VGTLFLLGPIFSHQQTRQRQIHDLSTLYSTRCNRVQVVQASFAPFYLLLDDLIWRRRELQARPWVSWLPSRFLLALCAQAFRCAHKPIRGWGQVTLVAIFRELVLQDFHVLTVLLDQGVLLREHLLLLLDDFVSPRQLFSQDLLLFSQICSFFFDRHARTLLGLTPFGKSPADLGSYDNPLKSYNPIVVLKNVAHFERHVSGIIDKKKKNDI
jgi:hypothetical protein